MEPPVVAIVGRPNVGKSSLFNRLIGQRRAIVDEMPGLTRDRLYAVADWGRRRFTLIDTAGLDFEARSDLRRRVAEQTRLAIRESQLVLFVLDVRAGVLPLDRDVAQLLRESRVPTILVGNKAERTREPTLAHELYELGLGDPLLVSATHGTGVGELLDQMAATLPAPREAPEPVRAAARLAIVGRPNVGKSSLLNAILGDVRSVVGPEPGTTRDPVDTWVEQDGQRVILIDTGGIRRRGAVGTNVEHYSLLRGLRAMQRADVALLVLDAPEGVKAQDQHIAGYAIEAGRGLMLIANKWDLVTQAERASPRWRETVRRMFPFAPFAPFYPVSALRRTGTARLLADALAIVAERGRRIAPSQLDRVLSEATRAHPPPTSHGRRLRVISAVQLPARDAPPTFRIVVNDPGLVHFSYRRYLENQLRRAFSFRGTPVRLEFSRRRESGRESARGGEHHL